MSLAISKPDPAGSGTTAPLQRGRKPLSPHPTQILSLLPAPGAWTAEDYLWLTRDTNQLIELTGGCLETLPMPTDTHQRVLLRLLVAFLQHLEPRGGLALMAPLKLRLSPDLFREPDILALLDRTDSRRGDAWWTGADLVAEVLGPGNRSHDTVTKRSEYAAAGIPEYWLVDPQEHRLTVLVLEGDGYREHGRFESGQTATSTLLVGFGIDVAAVFAS